MYDQEIRLKNSRIALFHGESVIHDCSTYYKINGEMFSPDKLFYHQSWDWLMPVIVKIEKIENGRFGFTIDPWSIEIIEYYTGNEETILNISREAGESNLRDDYYEAVTKFLEWYENNKLNENEQRDN